MPIPNFILILEESRVDSIIFVYVGELSAEIFKLQIEIATTFLSTQFDPLNGCMRNKLTQTRVNKREYISLVKKYEIFSSIETSA